MKFLFMLLFMYTRYKSVKNNNEKLVLTGKNKVIIKKLLKCLYLLLRLVKRIGIALFLRSRSSDSLKSFRIFGYNIWSVICETNAIHIVWCVPNMYRAYWVNLVKIFKIASLSWNLALSLIRICRIYWWHSLLLFSTRNIRFGENWSKTSKLSV